MLPKINRVATRIDLWSFGMQGGFGGKGPAQNDTRTKKFNLSYFSTHSLRQAKLQQKLIYFCLMTSLRQTHSREGSGVLTILWRKRFKMFFSKLSFIICHSPVGGKIDRAWCKKFGRNYQKVGSRRRAAKELFQLCRFLTWHRNPL